jgi:hypothetical protein
VLALHRTCPNDRYFKQCLNQRKEATWQYAVVFMNLKVIMRNFIRLQWGSNVGMYEQFQLGL